MSVADWIDRLLTTAALLGGYPTPDLAPTVSVVSQDDLAASVCAHACAVRGAYLPGQGILILNTLDIDGNPRDRSVLVHELVHYLQDRFGRFAAEPPCQRYLDREIEAYSAQDQYLSRYNMGIALPGGYWGLMPAGCTSVRDTAQAPAQVERER